MATLPEVCTNFAPALTAAAQPHLLPAPYCIEFISRADMVSGSPSGLTLIRQLLSRRPEALAPLNDDELLLPYAPSIKCPSIVAALYGRSVSLLTLQPLMRSFAGGRVEVGRWHGRFWYCESEVHHKRGRVHCAAKVAFLCSVDCPPCAKTCHTSLKKLSGVYAAATWLLPSLLHPL